MSDQDLPPEDYARWWEETGAWQLAEILYWVWDPIGVNVYFPNTFGEYDHYLDSVEELLRTGAAAEDIAGHLQSIERVSMELRTTPAGARRTLDLAERLTEWHFNSIAQWEDGFWEK